MAGNTTQLATRKPAVHMNDDLLADLCEHMSQGETLSAWCREPDRPNRRTVQRFVGADPERLQRYESARECGYDQIADEVLEIVDKPLPVGDDGRADPAAVAQRKLQVDARMRLLSVWNAAKFSERAQIEVRGNVRHEHTRPLSDSERALRIAAILTNAARRDAIEKGEDPDEAARRVAATLPPIKVSQRGAAAKDEDR